MASTASTTHLIDGHDPTDLLAHFHNLLLTAAVQNRRGGH